MPLKQINYTRPKLPEYQRKIIDSLSRFTVTQASTKSGKTFSHSVWLFEQALKLKQNQNVWWIAPVYQQAEMVFKRLKAQIGTSFFQINETKLTLTLPTGSVMTFKTAEKPDNLYGDDVHAAVFDEYTRAKEEAWFALRSTLTATHGKCKFIGNVKGKKNWGYKLGLKAQAEPADYSFFKITAYDAAEAGLISFDEIKQAERDLPPHVFKELYLAEASEDGANPFGIGFIQQCVKPLSGGVPVAYGVDLAKSVDWTVIIGLDEGGAIAYLDRFQKDWKQTTETIIRTVGSKPTLVDSTGVGDPIVEDLQRQSGNIEGIKFTPQSKQQLIEGLVSAIQHGKTSVIAGIHQSEMENFEYEYTRTGVRYTAPPGVTDDAVCAHALAWRKYQNKPSGHYEFGFVGN